MDATAEEHINFINLKSMKDKYETTEMEIEFPEIYEAVCAIAED